MQVGMKADIEHYDSQQNAQNPQVSMQWFPHWFILVWKKMTEGQLHFSYATMKRGSTHGSPETQFTFWLDTPHS